MDDHGIDLVALAEKLGDHSVFSPSGSAMWLNCSGSLIPNLAAPDSAGADAAEGTVAHKMAEIWLTKGFRPKHLVGTTELVVENSGTFPIEVTDTMLDFVGDYVSWCHQHDGDHFIETKVDFSDLTPLKNQRGTADFCACRPKHLTIMDLKYGRGVQVYAAKNTQLMIYAYGFFMEYDWLYDFQHITICICQPRLYHFDSWTISRAELLAFAEWVKQRAALAWTPNAPRTPGEKQCLWCKVKSSCTALAVMNEQLVDLVFGDLGEIDEPTMCDLKKRIDDKEVPFNLVLPSTVNLTVEQMAKLLPFRSMAEGWWKSIAGELERRLMDGEQVPGYKLVEGRSTREYVSPTEAADHLRFLGLDDKDIFVREMRSPAQIEEPLRALGYKRKQMPELLNSIIRKPPGRPTMCPSSDKRVSIQSVADQSFVDLDAEL